MEADKQGNIYIFHRPKEGTLEDPIVVVDSKGKFLRSFGKGLDPMSHGIKIDPAGHGQEISAAVLHGPRSAAWDQAENRMHAQAALMAHILG